jgi:hypothetical protein
MDALIINLQNLPQWMLVATGVLVASSLAVMVMVDDL